MTKVRKEKKRGKRFKTSLFFRSCVNIVIRFRSLNIREITTDIWYGIQCAHPNQIPLLHIHPAFFQLSVHGHDYCKRCRLIGPMSAVRFHIVEEHSTDICHICCGSSPIFASKEALESHLRKSHSISSDSYRCLDCKEEASTALPDVDSYKNHLLKEHLTRGDALVLKHPKWEMLAVPYISCIHIFRNP